MSWYVMRCKRFKEKYLNQELRDREIETYLPSLKVKVTNPRARKWKPYFPGYLFIRADLNEIGHSVLRWIPGAIGLVEFGGVPASVPDEVIKLIQFQLERANEARSEKDQRFKSGDLVEIQSGPFAKYRAIFDTHIQTDDRVRVLLKMLEDRHMLVELPVWQIEQVGKKQSQ